MCKKPFRVGVAEYGCGQCMPCRINARRIWTIRLVLEGSQHEASSFITLTYAPEYLPPDGSVDPRTLQLFCKRLRNRIGPFRFFGVGEYGDKSWRPHYHLVVFGHGFADHSKRLSQKGECKCAVCEAWGSGLCDVGYLAAESAAYIAGYCCKKMTALKDARLGGLKPEFARMSRRPGIGFCGAEELARFFVSDAGRKRDSKDFSTLRFGGKLWPMGRYLKAKTQHLIGAERKVNKRRDLMQFQAVPLSVQEALLASQEEREQKERSRLYQAERAEARIKIFNQRSL